MTKVLYLLLFLLIFVLRVNSSGATANESCSKDTKDQECGAYCYQVVKPLLDYAASMRTKELQFADLESKLREQKANLVNLKFQLSQQIELTALYKSNNALQEKQLAANDVQISALKSMLTAKDAQINDKDKIIKNMQAQQRENESNVAKIKQLESRFTECKAMSIAQICNGKSQGVHAIKVPDMKPFSVACDWKLAGSGWIVIRRRFKVTQTPMEEYKLGFGNLHGEFFIGLEKLHRLTHSLPHELYIHMVDFDNNTKYAKYSHFLIGNETQSYGLQIIRNYTGNGDDFLEKNLNMTFSTLENENESTIQLYKVFWYICDFKPLKLVQIMIRAKSS